MVVAAIAMAGLFWLLIYRFREPFMRAYGLFFSILLYFGLNKGSDSDLTDPATGIFNALSLARWAFLAILFVIAIRLPKPEGLRADTSLTILASMFLSDIAISTTYAGDFNYSFMRATSFISLSIAISVGFVYYLYWRANCVRFFRLHYYIAWLALLPPMLFYLLGLNQYGTAVIMGQYAGAFGNQNLFGVFSAMITPFVLFHWRAEAQTNWQKWVDVGLLAIIFVGLGLSRSRGGMLACLIAVATYFLVVKIESGIKIIAITISLLVIIVVFPSLQQSLTKFIRKDTIERAEIEGISKQIVEERRYELWRNVAPLYWDQKLSGYGFAMSHLETFPFSGDKEAGRHVHNSYLELFGDLGLPGAFFLLLVLCGLAARSWTIIERRGHYLQRNINAVFISIFAAGAVNAFFESWMFSVGNVVSLMFWGPSAGIVAQYVWRSVTIDDRLEIPVPKSELAHSMMEQQAK